MLSDRLLARFTSSLPGVVVRLSGRVQARLYRLTGGRLGGRFAGEPVLLLTTIGRRSGTPRTTTVLYGTDGDRLIIIGSNAGSERPPAWALNLTANPEAQVLIGRTSRDVRAAELAGADRDRVWWAMNERYGGFEMYRGRTPRHFKVFALDPA